MNLPLYFDHNVNRAITEGTRQRGLDVLTVREDGYHRRSDDEMLARAAALQRVVFT